MTLCRYLFVDRYALSHKQVGKEGKASEVQFLTNKTKMTPPEEQLWKKEQIKDTKKPTSLGSQCTCGSISYCSHIYHWLDLYHKPQIGFVCCQCSTHYKFI